MKTVAVDTNVLLDYFFKREPGYRRAKQLIDWCFNGSIILMICLPVFLEYEWVTRSVYRRAKNDIALSLQGLVDFPNLEIAYKELVKDAINLYSRTKGISFTDCVIILLSKQAKVDDFITSDLKLKKLYKSL